MRKQYLFLGAGLAFGLVLGILLMFGLGGWDFLVGEAGRGSSSKAETDVGGRAPDFVLQDLSGNSLRLSDLRGSVVILNFWATWCTPCKDEMPLFQARFEQYAPQLRVLAVNFAEPLGDVQAFTDEFELTFDVLLDDRAIVQEMYRVRGYPTTFIVDAKGIIRTKHLGVLSEQQLDRYLQQSGLLNKD